MSTQPGGGKLAGGGCPVGRVEGSDESDASSGIDDAGYLALDVLLNA